MENYKTEEEIYIGLGRIWFDYWLAHPENEEWIFYRDITMKVLVYAYHELVAMKKICSIYDLPKEDKDKLKAEAKRINPNYDEKTGMRIVKVIHFFGYLSNI